MRTAKDDRIKIFFFLNSQYKINGIFVIKIIGKNKLKKAKGRNVFTEIQGARHDNKRSTANIKFKK